MLDFTGICVEVIEALAVYLSSLEGLGSSPLELHVAIESGTAASHSCSTKCNIKVDGLPAFFLDGNQFLQKLASSAKNFRDFAIGFHQLDLLQLECCKLSPGSGGTIAHYSISGWEGENSRLLVRTFIQQQLSILTNSITFTFMLPQGYYDTHVSGEKLKSYLHLLHVIRPEVHIQFRAATSNTDVVSSVDYKDGSYRQVPKTPFKLATSLHHYLHTENGEINKRMKLRLLKGGLIVLPACLSLGADSLPGDLLVTCMAALAPLPPFRTGELLRAQDRCSHVHVNVFGPAMLPLLINCSSELFLPSLWANWTQYGVSLKMSSNSNTKGLMPTFTYEVEGTSTGHATRHVVHIFLFLEYKSAAGSDTDDWVSLLDITAFVRENFYAVVSRGAERLSGAVHLALNKILFNHSSNGEVQCRMERALPVLAEAVASIVHHSTSRAFKERAMELLQVDGSTEQGALKTRLHEMLSRLANSKLGLNLSQSNVSSAPTEELAQDSILEDPDGETCLEEQLNTSDDFVSLSYTHYDSVASNGDLANNIVNISEDEMSHSEPLTQKSDDKVDIVLEENNFEDLEKIDICSGIVPEDVSKRSEHEARQAEKPAYKLGEKMLENIDKIQYNSVVPNASLSSVSSGPEDEVFGSTRTSDKKVLQKSVHSQEEPNFQVLDVEEEADLGIQEEDFELEEFNMEEGNNHEICDFEYLEEIDAEEVEDKEFQHATEEIYTDEDSTEQESAAGVSASVQATLDKAKTQSLQKLCNHIDVVQNMEEEREVSVLGLDTGTENKHSEIQCNKAYLVCCRLDETELDTDNTEAELNTDKTEPELNTDKTEREPNTSGKERSMLHTTGCGNVDDVLINATASKRASVINGKATIMDEQHLDDMDFEQLGDMEDVGGCASAREYLVDNGLGLQDNNMKTEEEMESNLPVRINEDKETGCIRLSCVSTGSLGQDDVDDEMDFQLLEGVGEEEQEHDSDFSDLETLS